MQGFLRNGELQAACEDLERRTLASIAGDFARLVYLASTRDYNTGEYYHEGLAWQFSEKTAGEALAFCHTVVFRRLVLCSIRQLVEQLETYASTTQLQRSDLVHTWGCLQPYRVAIPRGSSAMSAHLFTSNVKAALTVLHCREIASRQDRQRA